MNEIEWVSEIHQAIRETIQEISKTEVEKLYLDPQKLTDYLLLKTNLRNSINDSITSNVANEIGNRLRCGIWDARLLDRAFESVWTDQLQKALEDRVRKKVNECIDKMVLERLKI